MGKLTLICSLVASISCAHSLIEGTQVEDTEENREVYELVIQLQDAMRLRNADQIIQLVSDEYFEDMGTPDPSDDYGYQELGDKIPASFEHTKEVHLNFKIHDIVVADNLAYADIRYNSRALLDFASGSMWDSHNEFNRIEFKRDLQKKKWLIVSGL